MKNIERRDTGLAIDLSDIHYVAVVMFLYQLRLSSVLQC